jgi:ABC-2 type transport system permease protein
MKPFSYEFMRIKTIRSTWVIVTIATILTLAISIIATIANRSNDQLDQNWGTIIKASMTALNWFFGALLGIFAFGHEYRYGTIRPTLSAIPKRRSIAFAKFVVPAAVIASLTAITGALGLISARILAGDALTIPWNSDNLVRDLFLIVAQTALWAGLGAAVAAITRSQIAAIVIILVWPLVLEPLIGLVLSLDALNPIDGIGKFLPGAASNAMAGNTTGDVLRWPAASLTFTLTVIALMSIGTELFARRDA